VTTGIATSPLVCPVVEYPDKMIQLTMRLACGYDILQPRKVCKFFTFIVSDDEKVMSYIMIVKHSRCRYNYRLVVATT
jgi:hypothetical protein